MSSGESFNLHVQWHRDVHTSWGKERLYFWRLSFDPVYDQERVLDALPRVLDEHRVLSYAVYELWGEADLLLRIWLPTASTAGDFSASLEQHLGPVHLSTEADFQVRRHLRHWVWDDDPSGSGPDPERLLEPLDDETIILANRNQLPELELAKYESDGLLKRTVHAHGIKFAMVVTDSARRTPINYRNSVRSTLERIVVDRDLRIAERSLYEGSGFGNYLIMGRVDYPHYHDIQKLADQVNELIAPAAYGARTHTMLSPHHDFMLFQEQLPPSQLVIPVPELDAASALALEEGHELEVKASAFRDVHFALGLHKPEMPDRAVFEELVRAVVAFLNSDGGTVIVGAYERRRLPQRDGFWAEYPELGGYVVFGVDYDHGGDNLDLYQRRVRQKLYEAIEPAPPLWVSVVLEQAAAKPVLRIAIGRPDRDWYFLKRGDEKVFVVRLGNESKNLSGNEMINYQRARPRG